MVYFVILLFILVCVYRFDYCKRRKFKSLSYWGLFVFFVLMAGLRYRIGGDSVRYEWLYKDAPTLFELAKFRFSSIRFEPGFIVFWSIPRTFSPDFTYFQLFHALVVNSAIFWFIRKYARNPFLFLSMYFVYLYVGLNYQVLREALAVAVFLFSWPLLKNGKYWAYYPLALLGVSFHISAVFMLFLPLLMLPGIRECFKVGMRTVYVVLGLLVAGYFIQKYFYRFFMFLAVTETMVDRTKMYSQDTLSGQQYNFAGMISVMFRYVLYPIFAIFFYNAKCKAEKIKGKLPEWKEHLLAMTGVYAALMSIPVFIFFRFLNYLDFFIFLTVSNWAFSKLRVGKKVYRLRPKYWAVILLPMFFFQIYSYWTPKNRSGTLVTWMEYYPYSSRLDPQLYEKRERIFRYQ
ncbi:MAG: EpsG family protein [Muribaculum sp.]|nr:EpsG family protein [Muribaculum sp.]